MYLIRGLHNLDFFKKSHPNLILHGTIGNFDGLHKGHQAILSKIKNKAEENERLLNSFFYRTTCI